ncbi:diguanylate cyclase [Niveibacterium terrae]|uniref:tetratricopeptide repeat-containing diguanylate cyclase n=1 Tax=Niveibacterium terrae TaxID=3373598 RepID=UPI003A955323
MSQTGSPLNFSATRFVRCGVLALLLWAGQALALDARELYASLDRNPHEAARSAEATALQARQRGDRQLRLEALTAMAMAFNLIGDSSRARPPLAEALLLANRLRRHDALALLHAVEGEMLIADNRPQEGIQAFERALTEAAQNRDENSKAIVQIQYGSSLAGSLSLHARAAPILEAALAHFVKVGDRARQAETMSAFAALYDRLRETPRALAERRRALALISPDRQTYLAATLYYDLGNAAAGNPDKREAQAALERSIELSRSIGDTFGIAYAQNSLARTYIDVGLWREALSLLRQARPVLRRGQNALIVAQIDARTAICLARLGDRAAWASLEAAKPELTRHGDINLERVLREAQAQVNAAFHQYEAAYQAQQRLRAIELQLFDSERTRILSELSIRHETRQRDAENARLRLTQQIRDAQLAHQKTRQLTLQAGLTLALLGLVVILALLRRQTQLKARFEELALRDELTGAPNRRAIMARAAALIAGSDAKKSALALLDLDHFKQVNDSWGHDVGDEVLRGFYRAAQEALRDGDSLGRTGGEEWLLLLPEATESGATAAFQRIRGALQSLRIDGTPADYRVRFSMGLILFRKAETLSEALRRADLALYRAKEEGRDRVVIAA